MYRWSRSTLSCTPRGRAASGRIPLTEFYRLPGDRPDLENVLAHGELITAIEIPLLPAGARSGYLKVRDRASYEFALTSAAVALLIEDGVMTEARVALGGVGTIPWRAAAAEEVLIGAAPGTAVFREAAEAAIVDPFTVSGDRVQGRARQADNRADAGDCGRMTTGPRSRCRPRRRPAQGARRRGLPDRRHLPGSRTRGARAQHHRVRPGDRDRRRGRSRGSRSPRRHHARRRPRSSRPPRSGCWASLRRRPCRTTASFTTDSTSPSSSRRRRTRPPRRRAWSRSTTSPATHS